MARKTDDQLEEIARGALERNLGDVCDSEDSADSIYDEAYTIAFDALHDANACSDEEARNIADRVARAIVQP